MALLSKKPSFMGIMQVATRIWSISCTGTLMIYFSFMNPSSSWKRSHIATGSTPNKPIEKRQRNGNRGARKPLYFSPENVENSEQTVNEKSPFRGPRHEVNVQSSFIVLFCFVFCCCCFVFCFLFFFFEEISLICFCCCIMFFFPITTKLIFVMQKYYL